MLPSPSPPGNKDYIPITYSVLVRNLYLNGQTQIAIGYLSYLLNDAVTKILMF